MTYIINLWKRSHTNGTCCVWRGTDRKQFEREKEKAIAKYKPYKGIARLAVFSDYVIFSFADCADAFSAWRDLTYFKAPLAVSFVKAGKRGDENVR